MKRPELKRPLTSEEQQAFDHLVEVVASRLAALPPKQPEVPDERQEAIRKTLGTPYLFDWKPPKDSKLQ